VTAVVATLLLILGAGIAGVLAYASRENGGLAVKCYNLLDHTGTAACGRIRQGAVINIIVQAPIIIATCYQVVRRRVMMSYLVLGLSISLLTAGLCYVYMRSWEFRIP
jgi:hypothetical protein